MGWFNKKEEAVKKPVPISLPALPKLPELPYLDEDSGEFEQIHQLPSFPNNSLGDKFSQNIIKDAVTGKKEGDEEGDADEIAEENMQMMLPQPPRTEREFHFPKKNFVEDEREQTHYKSRIATKESEPIFVRIDKFEESLEIFEKTKEKISDINNLLKDIKKIKEDEEKELISWEKEIQIVKEQIEKIDEELFSKI